ncbi:TerD family protein [Dactylosporangium sp. NPDC000555]|uniref:TerD family protein n=1 Tax=Dactylosporangium sp. NPDC000555 TaxID=3154260 RepID=UPI003321FCE7
MSTWWQAARRADIGLRREDLPVDAFTITNRGWYLLYRVLEAAGARRVDQMAEPDTYITATLANHWGSALICACLDEWLQLGRWDGHAVVPVGVVHRADTGQLADTYELTPLPGTPLHTWLQGIGQSLATTPSGLHVTGQPRKDPRMTVNLVKGGKVDLTKAAGGTLAKVRIGLGWDARKTAGADFDLDASVVGLTDAGVSAGPDWFVYYNNLQAPGGVIAHQGDNLTGTGSGDDEQILIDLAAMPADVVDLRIVVTIYEARKRSQTFGSVENAFVRVVDEATGAELSRYDLTEDTEPGVNALVFAKLYRHNGGWSFRAIGDGFTDELEGLVHAFKI